MPLLEFMRDYILVYVDDNDKEIRQGAALAACKVLERHAQMLQRQHQREVLPTGMGSSVKSSRIVEKVVMRLLQVSVADPSMSVRKAVLKALYESPSLDEYLAQADSLRPVFIALNDESCHARVTAIKLAGRLAQYNPAYVSPMLRRHLLQLLTDMDLSPDIRHREESAALLDALIASAPKLIMPYISTIQKALTAKLKATVPSLSNGTVGFATLPGTPGPFPTLGSTAGGPAGGNPLTPSGPSTPLAVQPITTGPNTLTIKDGKGGDSFLKCVLATLGQLSQVAGINLRPYVHEIMPLIIDSIQDGANHRKRVVAVRALGQLVQSTGVVMKPYMEYPQLLGVLLRMLHEAQTDAEATRKVVMKVLGIIGALDPHTHKLNQASLSGEGKLEKEGVRPLRPQPPGGFRNTLVVETLGGAGGEDGMGGELLPVVGMVTSSDEYYPTIAINALMRLLRDPSMISQNMNVISALMNIFRNMGLNSVPYLPKVLPFLFNVMRNSDDNLCEFMFDQLTKLVHIVRQHMRRFLKDIIALVHEYWVPSPKIMHPILTLLAEISLAVPDDFRAYVPELLPKFVSVFVEGERTGQCEMVKPALETLEAWGSALEEHLHLLLPALVRLVSPSGGGAMSLDIRKAALRSMKQLLPHMQLSGYTSAILHPLIRVLDSATTEDLQRDAMDTICALAVPLGQDFMYFMPTIRKVVNKHRLQHEWFERLCTKMNRIEPPCMSDAEDWEGLPNGWAYEIDVIKELMAKRSPHVLPLEPLDSGMTKLTVDPTNLRRAWESSHRVTKDDWEEWMRHFSVELLKESPSPALRACHQLAQVHPTMARDLFSAGFVSCWSELDPQLQEQLVRSLEAALAAPTIPPEIVTSLLNLAEFMEHDDKRLPLDTRTLGALAEKCHAFAKALHYKEMEFLSSPQSAIEALIHINNQLRQPEAAIGALQYAQKNLNMELKESWYEKLQRWDEALEAYSRRLAISTPGSLEYHTAVLGKMRCLASLAEWDTLDQLCRDEWRRSEPHMRREMALIAAHAAWHQGRWEEMALYVDTVDGPEAPGRTATGAFLRSVLCVKNNQYKDARDLVDRARELMSTELAALVGESYERAYTDMIRVQQLTELEEVIEYKWAREGRAASLDPSSTDVMCQLLHQRWKDRLKGVQRHVDVWQSLFNIHTLVIPMHSDVDNWLRFAALCRKCGRKRQSLRMLLDLLKYDPLSIPSSGMLGYGAGSGAPEVMLAYLKHLWDDQRREDALSRLQDLVTELPPPGLLDGAGSQHLDGGGGTPGQPIANGPVLAAGGHVGLVKQKPSLIAKAYMRLGMWQWVMHESSVGEKGHDPEVVNDCLAAYTRATQYAPGWGKAWHQWALFNIEVMTTAPERTPMCVTAAIHGFFQSIYLGQQSGDKTNNLQDILRLLTLWFNHGSSTEAQTELRKGFEYVSIKTWLAVIPQIIARIHTNNTQIRNLIHDLLCKIGREHPQALMYPLLVAYKSQSPSRRAAAQRVLDSVKSHNSKLVEEAQLVSQELIRMAILWHEAWHEALEEASRLYFGESNVEAMLNNLLPLHEKLDNEPPTTLKEIAFVQAYGRELREAYDWLMKYRLSRKEAELHQAWDLYYHVFKRINKQLHSMTVLDLQYVAPQLNKPVAGRREVMQLAVPGTYLPDEPVVNIVEFHPQLHVISSKQRPRKLTIRGSDGSDYMFLLKGHEDLRQDERVMQLFGLVNNMLANDRITAERDLSIARYAVIPLSPNTGLIGWVPNCDTLHALIREYREARKIPLNWEHRLMLGMAPDYDHLTVIQKVEVFEYALDQTSGEDLHKVLWLKSRNSEVWLDRRTNYTRSTAVMSMVGYILGLGDRHPSNLMLDRYSGKLLHIDFGDCFEASMHREKFPEKVPFRLTRMMTKAMEVTGIQGNFCITCENVMTVLRNNKESVMAMLEAFVHDPLINWRLLNTAEAATEIALARETDAAAVAAPLVEDGAQADAAGNGIATEGGHGAVGGIMPSPPRRDMRERELREAYGQLGDANEVLNERAISVMQRMRHKLCGQDYQVEGTNNNTPIKSDTVASQVERLISQAISHENLCQSYIGWCPFW